jgi:hypothetical protein
LDSSGSGYGPVAGSCEHGNEPLGSTKYGEFDTLSVVLASQEGLCYMELVRAREHVSHPYKSTDELRALYVFIF